MGAVLSSRRRVAVSAGLAAAVAVMAAVLKMRAAKNKAAVGDDTQAAKPKLPSDASVIGELLWPKFGQGGLAGRGQLQMIAMLLLAIVRTYLSHRLTLLNRDIEFAKQALNTKVFIDL